MTAVQPYGLVLKAGSGIWSAGSATRTYRVDRVTGVEVGDGRFDRDEDFDLAGHWRKQAARSRDPLRAEVTVRLSPAGLRAAAGTSPSPRRVDDAGRRAGDPTGRAGWWTGLPVESLEVAYDQLWVSAPRSRSSTLPSCGPGSPRRARPAPPYGPAARETADGRRSAVAGASAGLPASGTSAM